MRWKRSADGFKLDNTPHYFTVKDGSCPPLTVTNAPLSGILLHKISTADGKGIPGVSFILYDSGHNPIDQQTTDDRGCAWFEDRLFRAAITCVNWRMRDISRTLRSALSMSRRGKLRK